MVVLLLDYALVNLRPEEHAVAQVHNVVLNYKMICLVSCYAAAL